MLIRDNFYFLPPIARRDFTFHPLYLSKSSLRQFIHSSYVSETYSGEDFLSKRCNLASNAPLRTEEQGAILPSRKNRANKAGIVSKGARQLSPSFCRTLIFDINGFERAEKRERDRKRENRHVFPTGRSKKIRRPSSGTVPRTFPLVPSIETKTTPRVAPAIPPSVEEQWREKDIFEKDIRWEKI